MLVWRRWIFPILLVLIFGLIAASLAKIAFFSETEEQPLFPTGAVTDPVVFVEQGSIVNTLGLQGTIARDADVSVKANLTGTVTAVNVASGAEVAKDAVLFTVKQEYPAKWVDVVAPEAGKLGDLDVVVGQDVSLGSEVTKLTPNRYHVLATVEPVQLYRLLDAPSEAEVTITGGPAPFTCVGLSTQVTEDGVTSVRCSIPTDQVVFPGLPTQLEISVGSAEDVLTIPATAVKGGTGSGLVWLIDSDGEPTETPVKLGMSDGTLVEVVEGLSAGDEIRQFVPGSAAPVEEFCYEIAPGEEYCESGVSW